MKIENENMPAFPLAAGDPKSGDFSCCDGLTKREWFAGMALQGILAASADRGENATASLALKFADQLLKQLEK